jgi:hypothetical protein
MIRKFITLEFVVQTVSAVVLAIVLSIGAIHLTEVFLGSIEQVEAHQPGAVPERSAGECRASRSRAEGESQMIKPKKSAEQQVADEADRRSLNPIGSRQTIAESQAAPEFQENLKRLKAERLAREAGPKAKAK